LKQFSIVFKIKQCLLTESPENKGTVAEFHRGMFVPHALMTIFILNPETCLKNENIFIIDMLQIVTTTNRKLQNDFHSYQISI
jgi:hypothetical protein